MSLEVTATESAAVHQLLALYNHAVDNGEGELLDESVLADEFTITVDGSHFSGSSGIAAAEPRIGGELPAHHTLSTIVRRANDGTLRAWSRQILITGDGRSFSGDLFDVFRQGPEGWRLAGRTVRRRNRSTGEPEATFSEWYESDEGSNHA